MKGRTHRRRGSSYLFFLGSAMAVTVIGLSALKVVRIQRASGEDSNDLSVARIFAQSAIEHGFTLINNDQAWRSNLGNGPWVTNAPIQNGTYGVEAVFVDDGDGNPNNDDVVLIGTGASGAAIYKLEVTLIAQGQGVTIAPGSWKRTLN